MVIATMRDERSKVDGEVADVLWRRLAVAALPAQLTPRAGVHEGQHPARVLEAEVLGGHLRAEVLLRRQVAPSAS